MEIETIYYFLLSYKTIAFFEKKTIAYYQVLICRVISKMAINIADQVIWGFVGWYLPIYQSYLHYTFQLLNYSFYNFEMALFWVYVLFTELFYYKNFIGSYFVYNVY